MLLMLETVDSYIERNREAALGQLKDFLRFESISTSSDHVHELSSCAQWLADHLEGVGMEHVKVMPTAGNPVVYAEWLGVPGKPTVLIYGHYDVQPPEPLDEWDSKPFRAEEREGYLYARGASDDKGQLFCHIKGVEAYLAQGLELPVNVKMIFEGEEEIGSPSLASFLEEHQELLQADVALVSDTNMFAEGMPSLCVGLRGLCYMEVVVRGAKSDLHSGQHGGAAPNPINALCSMVAQLKNDRGEVQIPGFYDGIKEMDREILDNLSTLPFDEERYREEIGAPALVGDHAFSVLERLWLRPTLDCNGVVGGFTGEGAKTVIPATAKAKVSMRLVAGQDHEKIADAFEQYVRSNLPVGVTVDIIRHSGGQPVTIDRHHYAMEAAGRALKAGFGQQPVFQAEGGSIPVVSDFNRILGLTTVLMGFNLPNDNIHAPNERFKIDNFYGGIVASAAFFEELGSLAAVEAPTAGRRHQQAVV